MTLLYQPISRTFGQRDGCLTPISSQEGKEKNRSDSTPKSISENISTATSSHEILSPPLSPYQSTDASHDAKPDTPAPSSSEHYLAASHPFKINNYKSYSLTVNPWSDLNSHYKQRQMDFLSQYNFEAPRASSMHAVRVSEKRAEKRRREVRPTASQSDSDSDPYDRVRTRKLVRENSAVESETSSEVAKELEPAVLSSPSPKRRRVRKEPSYDGSPLAVQQAALIDESIPDYSPDSMTTLPKGNTRALKIEWKGQPMDLRDDPNLDKLHPAEVALASTLRLRCNVYLDSKRRFFFEKVNRMRSGMPFRRTDAQKACRIDVNKASRLFAAFEKAGWLDDKHFKQYL